MIINKVTFELKDFLILKHEVWVVPKNEVMYVTLNMLVSYGLYTNQAHDSINKSKFVRTGKGTNCYLQLKEYLEHLLNKGLNSGNIDFFDHLPQIKQ